MKQTIFSILCWCLAHSLIAQYAPAPPSLETKAVHKDSSIIKGWATSCEVKRGYIDANNPNRTFTFQDSTSNRAFFGVDSNAVGNKFGPGDVVSLGDKGEATLSFSTPIVNGPGPDFVVFENGFQLAGEDKYYLELAKVGVYSPEHDSTFFFPCYSETPTDKQLKEGEGIDPRWIYGFAGKYPYPYGTPFDIADLPEEVQNSHFTQVIIQDVGGMIEGDQVTFDNKNTPINDPYPTPYHTGGFDLMAVGVIHQKEKALNQLMVYPNPVSISGVLNLSAEVSLLELYSLAGNKILLNENCSSVQLPALVPGLYLLKLHFSGEIQTVKLQVNALD